ALSPRPRRAGTRQLRGCARALSEPARVRRGGRRQALPRARAEPVRGCGPGDLRSRRSGTTQCRRRRNESTTVALAGAAWALALEARSGASVPRRSRQRRAGVSRGGVAPGDRQLGPLDVGSFVVAISRRALTRRRTVRRRVGLGSALARLRDPVPAAQARGSRRQAGGPD